MFSFKWHIAKHLLTLPNKYVKGSRVGIWLYKGLDSWVFESPAKVRKRFLHSCLCGPPTDLFNWYQTYFSSVVKIPKTHLLSAGNSSFISTLFQIRDPPLFLKTLSYQENLFSLNLGPFYSNCVYVVNFRYRPKCNQAERKRCYKNVFTNGFPILRSVSREEIREER